MKVYISILLNSEPRNIRGLIEERRGLLLKKCPKCGVWMLEVDPHDEAERCYNCGYEKKIQNIKEYYFEKDVTYKLFSVKSAEPDKAFYFHISQGVFAGEKAASLEEFAKKIKLIDIKSLEFHLQRRDFERWMVDVFGEAKLAEEIRKLWSKKPNEPTLREQLYSIILSRVGGNSR